MQGCSCSGSSQGCRRVETCASLLTEISSTMMFAVLLVTAAKFYSNSSLKGESGWRQWWSSFCQSGTELQWLVFSHDFCAASLHAAARRWFWGFSPCLHIISTPLPVHLNPGWSAVWKLHRPCLLVQCASSSALFANADSGQSGPWFISAAAYEVEIHCRSKPCGHWMHFEALFPFHPHSRRTGLWVKHSKMVFKRFCTHHLRKCNDSCLDAHLLHCSVRASLEVRDQMVPLGRGVICCSLPFFRCVEPFSSFKLRPMRQYHRK